MSMSDPIGDMLTRIRNAQAVYKPAVSFRKSKIKSAVLQVMKEEGYISDFREVPESRDIEVDLKYYAGEPVIDMIKRVSRPGLSQYRHASQIERVRNGLGIAILSTSKGVVTDFKARELGVGGEVICHIA